MASIYRYAYITIAATAAQNSREGCFRRAEEDLISRPLRHNPGLMVQGTKLCENPFEFDPRSTQHPLLRRAWVHQERRPSASMVHFTSKQLVWECKALKQGENGLTYQSIYNGVASTWQSNMNDCSGLHLTSKEDRLAAIAAIVEDEMKLRPDDIYIAGMWKNALLDDLMWQRYSGFVHPRPSRAGPSWSWVSTKADVFFREIDEKLASVNIRDVIFTPKEPAHMGGQSNASLVLRGPMTDAAVGDLSLGSHR
jgi:hypothetical protein